MNAELKVHIAENPSSFNHTDIARQMQEIEDMTVRLYADVRDKMWTRLIDERTMLGKFKIASDLAIEILEEALEEAEKGV
jgi:hypothetical protein